MSINRKAAACLLALMLGSGVGVASNRFVYRAVKDTITQHKDTTKQDVKKGKATEKEKDKPSAYDQLVKKKEVFSKDSSPLGILTTNGTLRFQTQLSVVTCSL